MLKSCAGWFCLTKGMPAVYMFAALIGKMEGLPPEQQEILEIAAILHDIGIIPAEKKYGFNNGKLQEQEGPAYARALLQEAGGYPPELIDRVCFLIAHHHTYEGVDGPDWQILLEADFPCEFIRKEYAGRSH